jgi:hypothetical protein
MKAANNPNGIPRVRKTFRLDNDLLVTLTMFSSKSQWAESEIVEEALWAFLREQGAKEYIQKLKK